MSNIQTIGHLSGYVTGHDGVLFQKNLTSDSKIKKNYVVSGPKFGTKFTYLFAPNIHFLVNSIGCGLQDMKLRSFGSKIGTKFTHLSQTRTFCKISFLPYFSIHYLSLWWQVSKKSLERIARYEVTQFWAENWDQIYPFVPNEDFLQNFIPAIFSTSYSSL